MISLRPSRRAALLLAAALPLGVLAVEPGDSREQVEARLGEPTISRRLADGTVRARYRHGEVLYRADTVVTASILTDEALAERRETEARIEAERAERLARARAEQTARLDADRDALHALLESPEFRLLSPSGRLGALRDLKLAHPTAATERLDADLVAQIARRTEADWKILRLERELAATRAELLAVSTRLKNNADFIATSTSAPTYGFSTTVLQPGRPPRPGQPGVNPINNTPQVGTPGAIIPYNPVSNIIVTPKNTSTKTGANASTGGITPYNPVSGIIVTPKNTAPASGR